MLAHYNGHIKASLTVHYLGYIEASIPGHHCNRYTWESITDRYNGYIGASYGIIILDFGDFIPDHYNGYMEAWILGHYNVYIGLSISNYL
jgi:hypothetical protein